MKTKRFILMLLVALMSVTGAWAKIVRTDYTIVSNQFSLISGIGGEYYKSNNSQANMVIKTNQPIFLAEVYVLANLTSDTAGFPDKIKIEGSNNQSAWTTIKENSLGYLGNTVSVSVSDKYQYFRLTFYTSQNSFGFTKLTISEDKIEGEGTSQNPYTLNNVLHLKQYADLITEGNNAACAKLTTNLDMSQTTFASIDNANYVGTIDGNGYSIKNLNNVSGLFKSIGAATIKNLTIENATLSATDEYSGAIASQANGTTFQNCIVKGTISASSANVGGLVGNANGTSFTQCLVLSDFSAVGCTTVGGLAGVATNNATFTKCYSTGNFSVEGTNCGGLVGMASGNTKLTQCYSVGDRNIDGTQPIDEKSEIRPTFVSTTTPNSYNNSNPPSNLVDAGGTDTRWCAETEHKDEDDVWNIVVTTGVATQLKTIRLWNADNQRYPKRRWKSIKVYGSASSNGDWTELKSDDNLNLAINNKGLAGEIEVNATQSYAYYKIDVLDNEGDNYMQMSDMLFVVPTQHLRQLPVCGVSDGSCTASLCYHYGSASSSLSTAVEQADVTSGRLAYLLNNGDYKGPYFQRIGTDAYPSLTNTGDGDDYVYLALDDATYTNACPHRDCTKIPFKAPTCVGALGNAEYNQCTNSMCKKYLLASNRNIVVSDVKEFTLSYKAVNIQDHTYNQSGSWKFSASQTKDNTTYHNVMIVSHFRHTFNNGDYVISYTSVDDDPTMNLHLFFSSNIGVGGFSVRFYVNGIERSASRINYPNSTSERHDEVSIDGLHKFDIIKVVYNYSHPGGNTSTSANFFIGTQKPLPTSHNLQKHDFHYNCIDGGCKDYYECSRCANVFTQNTTPESDADITTLSAVTLAPMGEHNFVEKHLEGNLYGMQCQNTYCTTFDLDNYVLKKYNNDTNLTLSYDGSTYTAKEPVSLIDGNAFVTPVAFDAPSLTYNRYYPVNVWNAWCTPFDVNASYLKDNGLTPAYIEGIHNYDDNEDGTIDRTVMEIVKISNGRILAGTPLLVRAAEGYSSQLELSDVTMKANDVLNNIHTETASTKYDFIGTYTGTTAAAGDNIYSLNTSTGALVHRTGKILPLRWYCQIEQKPSFIGEETSPALARSIYIRVIGEEDQVTGIRTLYNEADQTLEQADGIFDISGRKLSVPQRGKVNIINGKKQFVR